MDFGKAIENLKAGIAVARAGWNGKGMYVVLMDGYPEGVSANKETRLKHKLPDNTTVKIQPYMVIRQPDGMISHWAPSGNDTLAEDWTLVE